MDRKLTEKVIDDYLQEAGSVYIKQFRKMLKDLSSFKQSYDSLLKLYTAEYKAGKISGFIKKDLVDTRKKFNDFDSAFSLISLPKEESVISERGEYADIIFLQNSQDFDDFQGEFGTGIDAFFDATEDEMMAFLSQWDYGDIGEVSSDEPWGRSDDVYRKGEYVMAYNSRLGYAGLSRVL